MFVTRVVVAGGGSRLNPSISEIEKAVQDLDGAGRPSITLVTQDDFPVMLVIGPCDGRYGVEVLRSEEDSLHLIDPNTGPGVKVPLSYGGQATPTSKRDTVDLDVALAAIRYFARTGEIDRSLMWSARVTD